MPSTASTSKDTSSKPVEEKSKAAADPSQSLGVLEEDDEFEEFTAAGMSAVEWLSYLDFELTKCILL